MALHAQAPRFFVSAYLTPLKAYPVVREDADGGFFIHDDSGHEIYCLWDDDAHLSGGDWIPVETEEATS